jgi:hypothetical protein
VELWQQLVVLTESAYLYANSMQTRQRRIPIGGDDGKHKTWKEMLPHYERELNNFRRHIARLRLQVEGTAPAVSNAPLRSADIKLLDKQHKLSPLVVGEKLFSDADSITLRALADELQGLQFLRLSMDEQQADKTLIAFACDSAVNVLVGYFNSGKSIYLQPPTLETNANANDRGQAEVLLANALDASCAPSLNVHAYRFEAGEHTIELGKGAALVLGFANAAQQPTPRDAGLGSGARETVDWLFY